MGDKMALQKREILIAKEIDDLGKLLVGIVKDVRAGKTAAEIGTGSLTNFIEAISGVDQLDDEAKSNRLAALQTISLRLAEIVDVLLPKAV